MRFRSVLSLALCTLLASAAVAMADPPAPGAPPAKRGPQAEEFSRRLAELKTIIAQLSTLQKKYATANEDQRADIQAEYRELQAKGEKLEPVLFAAAEKAYAEAPNADKQVTNFLLRLLGRWVKSDDFEPACRVGKLLMEGKCDDRSLPVLAAVAAICVSDYPTAEKFLNQAQAAGTPPRVGIALKLLERKLGQRISSGQDVVNKAYDTENGDCPLDGMVQLFLQNQKRFEQAWGKEKALREEEAKSDNLPRVLLKTSKGSITLELFENEAPNTVANFVSLVERGFYDGVVFHRVLPGFMAQGGDPKGTGSGGPGYRIPCECFQPNHRFHFRGVLSMAKEGGGGSDGHGRDTGGSQFFLTFVPAAFLDGNEVVARGNENSKYTVFGRVIDGFDVLAKIQRRNPDDPEGPRPDKIVEAKVLRKRPHEYKPRKMPE